MNNNKPIFVNKQNINLLWDVLLDELHIDNNNKQLITNIRTVFESNISPFTAKAVQTSTLVDLNKHFLSQVVIAVYRLFPHLKQEQELKRINISSEEIQEPYKVEDIHSTRQNNFEKQVNQKRLEFEKSISLNKPKELDFTEKVDDGKIKEMDALIAETIARRNFDIEQYKPNLSNNTVSDQDPDQWLRPQETSVNQPNKELNNVPNRNQRNNFEDKLKYVSVDGTNNTNNTQNKKKVSWDETKLTNIDPDEKENVSLIIEEKPNTNFDINTDIFNKFKKVKTETPLNNTNELTNHINNISVPDVSYNEVTKQITELNQRYDFLNTKMDTLIDLVTKLTNHFTV